MKKYEFLLQNRNKILKFRFFDNFVRICWNIQWIFSVLRASTTKFKIHILRKIFKHPLKILRVAIFFPFSLNKFCWQKIHSISTDLMSKNSAHFLISDDNILFKKVNFLFNFLEKSKKFNFLGKKNCAKLFHSKVVIFFFWLHI